MEFRKGIEKIETSKGEVINVKKSKFFGWGIVYPWKNEDGSWNWFNILTGGSWAKVIIIAIIVLIIFVGIIEYRTAVNVANECLEQSKNLGGLFPFQ